MFNNRAPEQLGYTHEELARLHVYELDAQMSREEIQQCFSSNFAGKKLTFETKHRASNGELRDVFITGQAITFEGREVVFASALDITDNKRAEQALREAEQINRHALEQRVEERTRELAEVNRELEAFAYSVSHDLRAPLRSVDGFGKILLRDYPGKVLDDRAAGYIRRMSAATKRMEQLIQDLLNLSRVSRGEFKKQTVDLSSVASSVVAELREADPGRQVRVDIQPGMTCIGDARLLRVALHNLLGNAWKFTSKTADATIEFHSRLEGSDTVYSVRDNGAGFDMAHAEHLFAPFQRLHQTHEFDGTGIGLAIVHRVIGRHGGRVSASGKIGEGATFEFTLGSL